MPPQPAANGTPHPGMSYAPPRPSVAAMDSANHHAYTSSSTSQQSQVQSSSSSAASAPAVTANTPNAPKKRTQKGAEKKRRKEGGRDGAEGSEKKPQVSSCDACKEAHRKVTKNSPRLFLPLLASNLVEQHPCMATRPCCCSQVEHGHFWMGFAL